ncbi:MAG TPA: efflux RND transporter permease subunit, partial [Ginsengibacter sp.]|nr:efflux RND transporter permease subunit [Ginsengibacter sp.]
AVMHHLHKNKKYAGVTRISQDTLNKEVEVSAGKLMNAAVFGQVIILIVYLPILTLHGIEGKMFRPMAQTVTFAIIGAFLLSLTYIPMMSSLVLSKKLSHKDTLSDKLMRKVERGYRLVLEKALAFPKIVMLFALFLFGWAIYILSNLGGEFIPQLEEGDFAVDFRVLTGSSLTTTVDYAERASRLMEDNFPEVEKVVTRVGSPEIPTDPMSMEAADLILVLKPKKEWTSAKTFDELAEKMSKKLEEIPGVTGGFQFPVQMRFNELISGGRQDVVCKVFGEDLDSLSLFAERLGTIAGTIKGARDIYVETVTGLPQIVVDYNRAALAQYGLNIETANKTLQAAFTGASAGQVFENERRFDLVVRLHGQERRSMEDVRNLLVAAPDGHQVPLGQVADIDIRVGPNQIQREDAQRRITVGFNVRGMDVETVVKDLQQKVGERLKLPPGYYVTYGGEFENLIAARARLSIAVPIALLLIFVLLYFAFHSVKQGLLIFSAIPLSAIGGICSLWIRGMPFSISAGVGFIALFGVAVLNGIVLMTEFNQL